MRRIGILETSQDPVTNSLIERHPAFSRRAWNKHPRTEDGIGPAALQRSKEIGQFFRGILPVTMDQSDDIKAVIDRVAIAQLLISAISLILRRA